MINKIRFNTNIPDKEEIIFGHSNILFSEGTNQAGKTTVLEMICATFLFNKSYIKDQLIFSENDLIKKLQADLYINGIPHRNKRDETGLKFSNEITNIETSRVIKKREFELGDPIDWPKGIKLKKIYSKHNYYKSIERDDFSFGIYYQIFYIDEKIGWNRYDIQKTINPFEDYNKYNINFYLFSRIFDSKVVNEEFEKFKTKFLPGEARYEEYFEISEYLKSLEGGRKIYNLEQAIKTSSNKDQFTVNNNKIKDLLKRLLPLKEERSKLKKLINKEEVIQDLLNSKIKVALGTYGLNSNEVYSFSTITNDSKKNQIELEKKLKLINTKISEINKEVKIYEGKVHEEAELIGKANKEFEEENIIPKIIQAKEIGKLNVDYNKPEFREGFGIRTESITDYIKNNIIRKNRNLIAEEQNRIIDNLIKFIYSSTENNPAVIRIMEQLNSLKKNCGKDNFFLKGAFENIQVLTERLAIINLWKGKIPLVVIDSPLRGEIEESQETNSPIENLYRKSIVYLLSEMIKISIPTEDKDEEQKIEQIIISSASLIKDKETIESLIGHKDKINWIRMKGLA